MKHTDLAWMAGFVDGEGCITISKQVRRNRPSPAYRAVITITNTNRQVLVPFLEAWGGAIYSVHEKRRDKRKVKWADAWCWHCPASRSPRMLRRLLPYLRLKREQALVVIDFCENKARTCVPRHANGRWGGSEHLVPAELARRAAWHKQIQLLNTKGQRARTNAAIAL